MKRILTVVLSILFVSAIAFGMQNTNSSTTNSKTKSTSTPRKPIFRATSDQIKQVQSILKQRALYAGEQTGKLDNDTRASLKKYQEAEGLKVTGTLNKVTLEKMAVVLTDKQKVM